MLCDPHRRTSAVWKRSLFLSRSPSSSSFSLSFFLHLSYLYSLREFHPLTQCLSERRLLSTPVLRSRMYFLSLLAQSQLLTPISQLGFGTWQSAPGQVGDAVYEALKAGYRHLVSHIFELYSRNNQSLTRFRIWLLCRFRHSPQIDHTS